MQPHTIVEDLPTIQGLIDALQIWLSHLKVVELIRMDPQ
jgi:hypothetical protein